MIQLVISFAIIFVIIIYPVMLAARLVGAGKTGFGSVVFAVFLQGCLGLSLRLFVVDELVAGLIGLVGGSIIYSLALDTTILRGFAVSMLSIVIIVVSLFLLAGIFTAFGM